ncbi:MAG: hypothetical protein M0Z71_11140 [Nitrospiraceae bacterium]|nr:hypothetical protein [Nitrospiraceae bacterium]
MKKQSQQVIRQRGGAKELIYKEQDEYMQASWDAGQIVRGGGKDTEWIFHKISDLMTEEDCVIVVVKSAQQRRSVYNDGQKEDKQIYAIFSREYH